MADRKTSENAAGRHSHAIPAPSFPTHNSPRTWLITQGLSPLAVRLTRLLLAHGDYVVACLPPHDIANDACSAEFRELANECRNAASAGASGPSSASAAGPSSSAPSSAAAGIPFSGPSSSGGSGHNSKYKDREGWKDRIRGIRCDGRFMGQCVAAVAEAVQVFGRIDIVLCCASEAIVGSVEELAGGGCTAGGTDDANKANGLLAHNLVRDQFETVFFSQVNFIKAALPQLRKQRTGHVMVLSSIGGHIGTPGMPIHTAATWALEGYCDSLAYEIAPFNIKVTIVQPQTEVQTLTNRVVFAPVMPEYEASTAAASATAMSSVDGTPPDDPEPPAPGVRDMLSRVLNVYGDPPAATTPAILAAAQTPQRRYPRLPAAALDRLVLETVHALTAIGGHENPPTRHIVGFEATTAVQEKLKTVSEELEDFVEASLSVDIFDSELKKEAREGRAAAAAAEQQQQQQVANQTLASSNMIIDTAVQE